MLYSLEELEPYLYFFVPILTFSSLIKLFKSCNKGFNLLKKIIGISNIALFNT